MFKKFKNIDDSFKQVRKISMIAIVVSMLVSIWAIYLGFVHAARAHEQIYVLVNGLAFEAKASNEQDNIQVEAYDHVSHFHDLVFNLDPDAKKIETNMRKAFSLSDGATSKLYENLRESGYIAALVSANMSESIVIDSIRLDAGIYPYLLTFHLYATEKLIRPTTITTRNLKTQGFIRKVTRSVDNSHGLLIERFEVLENKDLSTVNR